MGSSSSAFAEGTFALARARPFARHHHHRRGRLGCGGGSLARPTGSHISTGGGASLGFSSKVLPGIAALTDK